MAHLKSKFGTALALVFALVLGGCGGGSGVDELVESFDGNVPSVGPAPLVITTTTVPAGQPGQTYPATTLTAQGANDITWRVTDGTLPPGIYLTLDGRLLGTPATEGIFEFTAQALSPEAAAEQELVLAVGAMGLQATDGLRFGEAWSGRPVTLRCAGHEGSVFFGAVANRSGGRYDAIDPAAGTATWIPGPTPGIDILTVRDGATGATADLDLTVAEDPTAGHTARFGGHDVWFLDWHAKSGAHPFATDVRAALAYLGLRSVNGYGAAETETDRLAELCVQVEILRQINMMFGRNPDGSAGVNGLPISFAFERPQGGYVAPARGTFISGRANGYSVMALCNQSGRLAAFGVAFGDGIGNANHEHNAPGGAYGELGVFVNFVAEAVGNNFRLHGTQLRETPVRAGDRDALKAILHGRPSPGGRYDLLRYQIEALAGSIAGIAAHEVGHSLGLEHTSAFTPGAIMNASGILAPNTEYRFTPGNLDILRLGLPGPGRTGLQALKVSGGVSVAAAMAPGGMHVCGGGTCR